MCVFSPGSSRAAAGSKGGDGTAGKKQNATLHPLHTARYWKLPQWSQCESRPLYVHIIIIIIIILGHNDTLPLSGLEDCSSCEERQGF